VNEHGKPTASDNVYVITDVRASTLIRRRRRYLQLMTLRVLLVPGVFLIDVPVVVQVSVVLAAAVSQFVAVIGANTPDHTSSFNPNVLNQGSTGTVDSRAAITVHSSSSTDN
jgi:hypothetical protein